jgi:hypothetical protein
MKKYLRKTIIKFDFSFNAFVFFKLITAVETDSPTISKGDPSTMLVSSDLSYFHSSDSGLNSPNPSFSSKELPSLTTPKQLIAENSENKSIINSSSSPNFSQTTPSISYSTDKPSFALSSQFARKKSVEVFIIIKFLFYALILIVAGLC